MNTPTNPNVESIIEILNRLITIEEKVNQILKWIFEAVEEAEDDDEQQTNIESFDNI